MNYRIRNLTSSTDDVESINYKTALTTRLHPMPTFTKGELVKVVYYADHDGADYYANPVVDVSIEWVRDEDGVLKERRETRKWYLDGEGDELGDLVKLTSKFYTAETAAQADARRRSNIISNLTSLAGRFGVREQVEQLFFQYDDAINAYEKTGSPTIIQIIAIEGQPWLNAPVPGTEYNLRQVIIGEMSL